MADGSDRSFYSTGRVSVDIHQTPVYRITSLDSFQDLSDPSALELSPSQGRRPCSIRGTVRGSGVGQSFGAILFKV